MDIKNIERIKELSGMPNKSKLIIQEEHQQRNIDFLNERIIDLSGILMEDVIPASFISYKMADIGFKDQEKINWISKRIAAIFKDWVRSGRAESSIGLEKRREIANDIYDVHTRIVGHEPNPENQELLKDTFNNEFLSSVSAHTAGKSYKDALIEIRDWIEGSTANQDNSFEQTLKQNKGLKYIGFKAAINKAITWHQERVTKGEIEADPTVDPSLPQNEEEEKEYKKFELLKEYDDGYKWIDLNTNNSKLESRLGQHCGNTNANTMYSLRFPNNTVAISVAVNRDGEITQMKGKGNTKPSRKYHKYIVDLLTNGYGINGEFNRFGEEYNSKDDFHVYDLENEDLIEHLKTNNPQLLTEKDKALLDYKKNKLSFNEAEKYLSMEEILKTLILPFDKTELFERDILPRMTSN